MILEEGFLGVPKSEKPECTSSTRGFRRQGQRDVLMTSGIKAPYKIIFYFFRLFIVFAGVSSIILTQSS